MNLMYTFTDLLNLLPSRKMKKQKEKVRETVSQRRRILTKEQVKERSEQVRMQLTETEVFQKAQHILLYYPIHREVDLLRLVAQYEGEKQFYLPVTHRNRIEVRPYDTQTEVHRGRFGIPEPVSPTYKGKIDLIIVPAVAFDEHCHRLGRGGGYYDRFLRHQRHTTKIGVGYDFQLVSKPIPHTLHDQMMDIVVTQTKVVKRKG